MVKVCASVAGDPDVIGANHFSLMLENFRFLRTIVHGISQLAAVAGYESNLSTIPVKVWIILWGTPFAPVDSQTDVVHKPSICYPSRWIYCVVRLISSG